MKEIKQEVIRYQTEDGRIFNIKEWAEAHEERFKNKDVAEKFWRERTEEYCGTSGFLEDICDCHDGDIYLIRMKEGETFKTFEDMYTVLHDSYCEPSFYTFCSDDAYKKNKNFLLVFNSSGEFAEWVCLDTFKEDVLREVDAVLSWVE